VNIDNGLLPLAGGNLALEENIDFSVRSVLHLRKPDVGHGQTEGTGTGPNVTTLATEVGALEDGLVFVREKSLGEKDLQWG
jgi:hypothetical protein